jgi:hypothetical protein
LLFDSDDTNVYETASLLVFVTITRFNAHFSFCTLKVLFLHYTGRMASSRMLRRVALVRTDVSEERSTSFTRVTRIGVL